MIDQITVRLNPTCTDQQEVVEAELDMLQEHIVGYATTQEIRFPDTHTIYIDVLLRGVAQLPMILDIVKRT